MSDKKFNLHDQIVNLAKGHYLQTQSSFKGVQKIFQKCEVPSEPENIIPQLSEMVLMVILTDPDPVKEYTEQMAFLFKAIPEILKGMYITELDDVDDILVKARKSIIEVLTQSLLVILARSEPDPEVEIENPTSKILPVRGKEKE